MELSNKTFGSVGSSSVPQVSGIITHEQEQPQEVSFSDLQSLIDLGKIEDEIVLGAHKFILSTLSERQQEEVARVISVARSKDDFEEIIEIRRTLVAFAIKSVNGKPLEDIGMPLIVGNGVKYANEKQIVIAAKLAVIKAMQAFTIHSLYDFYEQLLKRSQGLIGQDQIKK